MLDYLKDKGEINNMSLILQKMRVLISFLIMFFFSSLNAAMSSELYTNNGSLIGQVSFEDSKYGLIIIPKLSNLPAGLHGFHIHQHPDCSHHGMSAGGHLDPKVTDSHQGPYGEGHLGDLPILVVTSTGEANTPMLAPRLTTQDIQGRAIMIHEGGDNYSDSPPLGGGGSRIGCGKIPRTTE